MFGGRVECRHAIVGLIKDNKGADREVRRRVGQIEQRFEEACEVTAVAVREQFELFDDGFGRFADG